MEKPVLGLIGGIGSGKSLVAAELARFGGRIIAGDQLGHEGLRQPEIKEEVVRRWGKEVLDENGEVNRRRDWAKKCSPTRPSAAPWKPLAVPVHRTAVPRRGGEGE